MQDIRKVKVGETIIGKNGIISCSVKRSDSETKPKNNICAIIKKNYLRLGGIRDNLPKTKFSDLYNHCQ